jgi:alpha-ketoglutarate-dependent taurine dioxygenase
VCTVAAGSPLIAAHVDAIEAEHCLDWRTPATAVIDNWKMLHRRPPVPGGEERVLRRWYIKGPN